MDRTQLERPARRRSWKPLVPYSMALYAMITTGVALAQDSFEVRFILSGKALSCFLEHRSVYRDVVGDTAFISPDLCPDGVSSDINDVLVAEGPAADEGLPSSPGAADVLIFLSADQFECLLREASEITVSQDRLYSFAPDACVLEASE